MFGIFTPLFLQRISGVVTALTKNLQRDAWPQETLVVLRLFNVDLDQETFSSSIFLFKVHLNGYFLNIRKDWYSYLMMRHSENATYHIQ